MTLIPIDDHVLIEVTKEETTASGLILVKEDNKPTKWTVVAVGNGRVLDSWAKAPMTVQVGDVVYFTKYQPDQLDIENKNYWIIREPSILAIERD